MKQALETIVSNNIWRTLLY